MALTPRFPAFLHGGDYNPDQWLDRPDILERDVELMREAHVNCVSVGIFAWAALEPQEGVYRFEWLDQVIDRLWEAGIHVDLATPSGARPAWLAQKYPEVLRCNSRFERDHFGGRHNHCPSSPVYREKVRAIDSALAARYARHPAVILWHLSNELGGDCYCPLCQERFRAWLKARYGTLEYLNRSWWNSFWSMAYTDWSQIEPPSPRGQMANPAMLVDWRRFSTSQCADFVRLEREAVKAAAPELPVTANLMHRFYDYDYFELARELDVVSWDAYPEWHHGSCVPEAVSYAMWHDVMRSLKKQPFLLMESTPSLVNWRSTNKLKRPGMHLLSSMQAVAHGSDSVMYFQWRKGRGGAEMFHGAVVSHDGRSDTRVFRDVTQVGEALERLMPVYGQAEKPARVLIIYDWHNRWALDMAQALNRNDKRYTDTVCMHYQALWRLGVSVDFADMRQETDLSGYDLVIAPMLYMMREDFGLRLRGYVARGGTLVTTYFSGLVDERGLAFLGDAPHALTDVLGLRAVETDALWPEDRNTMVCPDGRRFALSRVCELAELEGAETLAAYGEDFYAGKPCLTRHRFGQGTAYYLAAQAEQAALDALYGGIADALGLDRAWPAPLPEGVAARERAGIIWLQNYGDAGQVISTDKAFTDLLTGETLRGEITLKPFDVKALCPEADA